MLHDSSHMIATRPQNNIVQALHPLCPATNGTPNQWQIASKHCWGSDSFIRAQQSCKCYLSSDETWWIGSHDHQSTTTCMSICSDFHHDFKTSLKPCQTDQATLGTQQNHQNVCHCILRTHYAYHAIHFRNISASTVNVFADMYRRYQRQIFRP